MELQLNDRALEILKDGLSISQTFDDKYDIFKKIMSLASNSEGTVIDLNEKQLVAGTFYQNALRISNTVHRYVLLRSKKITCLFRCVRFSKDELKRFHSPSFLFWASVWQLVWHNNPWNGPVILYRDNYIALNIDLILLCAMLSPRIVSRF